MPNGVGDAVGIETLGASMAPQTKPPSVDAAQQVSQKTLAQQIGESISVSVRIIASQTANAVTAANKASADIEEATRIACEAKRLAEAAEKAAEAAEKAAEVTANQCMLSAFKQLEMQLREMQADAFADERKEVKDSFTDRCSELLRNIQRAAAKCES